MKLSLSTILFSCAQAAVVTQIGDGQIQATTGVESTVQVVSQIGDGQIQATTYTPSPTYTPQSTVQPVSQIGDGQIQATTATASSVQKTGTLSISSVIPISQISDGQIQATTGSVRTVSTLFGSDYSAISSSKAVSGDLSGSLVTVTTTNANGVSVTIVGSAVVTGSDGAVTIGTARATGTGSAAITQIINGGAALYENGLKSALFGASVGIMIVLNSIFV